jgi:RNA polymerase sigma-70 factor (ECF subfamily)
MRKWRTMQDANAIPTDDEQLARRAQGGCSSSFEALVRRVQVPLLHFLIRQLRNRSDAEDVLQETFVRAYVNLASYNPRWRVKTWLFAIARNLAVSHRRTMRVVSSSIENVSDDVGTGREDAPHARLADAEQSDALWRIARQTLSDEQFAALWLFYVEEMSAPEIAKVLGRSWVSVKTMLHRARKRLGAEISKTNTRTSNEVTHERPIAIHGR